MSALEVPVIKFSYIIYKSTGDIKMADSGATVNSSETAKSKDAVILFSKLLSFQKAKCEVNSQLNEIIGKDQIVEIMEDNKKTYQTCDYRTVTAVVVIDARQTRTLITPSRRDANVDHWDELERLESVTKPKGSILLVIYGDEASKRMENKLVADKWLTVWKFNDEHATMFVKKNRCFTLWDKFNPEQEKQIKQYIYTLPFIIYKNHFNILVVGDKEEPGKYHDQYLKLHPFYDLSEPKESNGKSGKIDVYEYQSLNITKTSKQPPRESFKVHYANDDTINICEKNQDEVTNELGRLKDLITKTTFQNNIVFCHCMRCVEKLLKKSLAQKTFKPSTVRIWHTFMQYM
ncbi:uncharacterized protein [Ptychodera flava]|uniref:uncharacterized protein isoform X2 n=1 Tax=Ptychodera flava TaxID=63121 RepID=UPI00396AAF08